MDRTRYLTVAALLVLPLVSSAHAQSKPTAWPRCGNRGDKVIRGAPWWGDCKGDCTPKPRYPNQYTPWQTKWTGSHANIDYTISTPYVSMRDPSVGGVQFRLNNMNSVPVRVCFDYRVIGKQGVEDSHSVGAEPERDSYCLDAPANSTSEHVVYANVHTTHKNTTSDIQIEISNVTVWGYRGSMSYFCLMSQG